jgi:putative ABC transport system ATP-binding protein
MLLRLQGINKTYQTDEVETHALRDINLDIERGEYVSIEGPSGCGKSTLLSIIGLLDAPTTVQENVELPLTYRGVSKGERRRRVSEVLERVNIAHRAGHYPAQLSGGQQQRVAVARALAGNPSVLLADEPTGNLDSVHGAAVMELLAELHESGSTIVMVTHDRLFARYAKRTVGLLDGRLADANELVEARL